MLCCVLLWLDTYRFNSLAPGKFEWNFRYVISKQILVTGGWGISCEIALIWTSLDFTDDQSTLVQVMAWCHQATSHNLSQCWPRSLSPYGVTRPQWVNPYPLWLFHWQLKIVLWTHCQRSNPILVDALSESISRIGFSDYTDLLWWNNINN